MAAPLYAWQFVEDIMGDRVPKIATFEASATLETKVGTLVKMVTGQVDEAGNTSPSLLGLAAQKTAAPLSAADPIKVEMLFPGAVIKGTADADATTLAGFNGKLVDLNADGSLDVGDVAAGCLSVMRVEVGSAGLTVYCVVTALDSA